jgi:hypothetical protein
MKSLLGLFILLLSISTSAFIMEPEEVAKPLPTVTFEQWQIASQAILDGDIKTLKELVELQGLDPHFSKTGMSTIFHTFARDTAFHHKTGLVYPEKFSDESIRALQYLVNQGASVNRLSSLNGITPLAKAFRGVDEGYPQCRAKFMKFLLENGADPDKGNRSSASYRVWSPFQDANPFCGTEALDIYFSYKPDFKKGRCELLPRSDKRDQETLLEYLGEGHYTPIVMLYRYLETQNIPLPFLDGAYGVIPNPAWDEYKKTCPDEIYKNSF